MMLSLVGVIVARGQGYKHSSHLRRTEQPQMATLQPRQSGGQQRLAVPLEENEAMGSSTAAHLEDTSLSPSWVAGHRAVTGPRPNKGQ